MSTIGITDRDKEAFEELKPDDMTQAEFTHELLKAYRQQQNGGIDMDYMIAELAEHIDKTTASKAELAAYRGVTEALQE